MRKKNKMSVSYPSKIIALWTVFLLGTLFHTQLALMPLFHGISVAESHTHEFIELSALMWLMLGFFLLPLIAILITAFYDSRRYRIANFGLSIVYTVMNFLHVFLDLLVRVPNYQIALMLFLFFVGVLLNITSFRWMKHRRRSHQEITSISG